MFSHVRELFKSIKTMQDWLETVGAYLNAAGQIINMKWSYFDLFSNRAKLSGQNQVWSLAVYEDG